MWGEGGGENPRRLGGGEGELTPDSTICGRWGKPLCTVLPR